VEIIKLLIQYANKHNILLDIDDQDRNGNYPFLIAVDNEDIYSMNLLIDITDKNNIIIDMNKTNVYNNNCLLLAVDKKKEEIVKIIINYADSHYNDDHKLDLYKIIFLILILLNYQLCIIILKLLGY